MALIDGKCQLPWPSIYNAPSGLQSAVLVIHAVNEEAAGIFIAPRAGNISKLHFCTGTVTTGATVTVALKTLDGSGDPAGVVASKTLVIDNTDDNKHLSVTLNPVAAVTAGVAYALTVAQPAAAAGDMTVQAFAVLYAGGSPLMQNFPYSDLKTAGWVKQNRQIAGAVEYDTGNIYNIGAGLFVSSANAAVNNTTTPDEIGNVFTLPFPARVGGVWFNSAAMAAGADFTAKLYDGANNLLASVSLDGDDRMGSTGPWFMRFGLEVDLTAGSTYRVTILPATANSVTLYRFTVADNVDLAIVDGGSGMYETSRKSGGAWTNTNTRRIHLGLLLSGFDNGVIPPAAAGGPSDVRIGGY